MHICIYVSFPLPTKMDLQMVDFWCSQLFDSWRVSNIFIALIFSWLSFSWLLEERTGTSRITKLAPLLCHSMPLLWRTKTSALDCPCASTVHFLHHGSYKHDHVLVGNGCPLWNLMICIYICMLAWIDLIYDTFRVILGWLDRWLSFSLPESKVGLSCPKAKPLSISRCSGDNLSLGESSQLPKQYWSSFKGIQGTNASL